MDAKKLVQSLYVEVLSKTSSPELMDKLAHVLAPSWQSIGDYSGQSKTREAFGAQLAGFAKLIPDLSWTIEEMFTDGDRVIVRGRASGTPVGEFFGVPPSGKRFEIMSVDIHTIEGDQIARTHHVEDWAGALRQLRS